MKYVMLLALIGNLNYAMQRIAILEKLADEKSSITKKMLKDAHNVFKLSTKKYDTKLTSKALWGLAAAWDDSFGDSGLELAQFLIVAGAHPKEEIMIEEFLQVRKNDGTIQSMATESYETTPLQASSGSLKKYFETQYKP